MASRRRLVPILLSQAVGLGCGVAGVKVVSEIVPPGILGVYSLFLTLTPLGVWLLHSGLVKYLGRHWAAADNRAGLFQAVRRAWARRLPALLVASALGTFALVTNDPTRASAVTVLVFVAAGSLSLVAFGQTALQVSRNHWRDFALTSVSSLSRTFAPALLFLYGGTLGAMFVGFSLHAVLTAGVALALAGMWARGSGQPVRIAQVYEGRLFLVLAATAWALAGMNRWVVAAFFGETTAGQFALAMNISQNVAAVLGGVLIQYLQPTMNELGDSPDPSSRRRLLRLTDAAAAGLTVAGLLGLFAIEAVGPWLVGPLINERYVPALRWIIPSGCFALTTMIGYFYHVLLLAARRERACGTADLASAALLVTSVVIAASAGERALSITLTLTPLVPWLLARSIARQVLTRPPA